MAIAFSRSVRSLQADTFRRPAIGILIGVLLLGGWSAWLFLARISVYEATPKARLEVDRAVHPVEAPISGRVVAIHLVLGQEVQAGEVLVELDSSTQRLQLQEYRTQQGGLARQLEKLGREVQVAEQALRDLKNASEQTLKEAAARQKEAERAALFAKEEWKRKEASGVAELEVLRAKADAERLDAAAETARLSASRVEWEQRTKESEQQARIAALDREGARIESEIATGKDTIRRLDDEIAKRRVLAPISGRIGEIAGLRLGAVIREGDRLGAVVPVGSLKAVAEFPPPSALGRIRPGQRAQLRLDGFPWTQYGFVSVTVSNVASEVRNGTVQVEFAVKPDPASTIPLQHGLPGTIEVEVDRASPATLILRAAGRLLAGGSQR